VVGTVVGAAVIAGTGGAVEPPEHAEIPIDAAASTTKRAADLVIAIHHRTTSVCPDARPSFSA
jgi:hypothetical protein